MELAIGRTAQGISESGKDIELIVRRVVVPPYFLTNEFGSFTLILLHTFPLHYERIWASAAPCPTSELTAHAPSTFNRLRSQ